jgi:hypothetical protein
LRRKLFLRGGEQNLLHRGAEVLPTCSVIVKLSDGKEAAGWRAWGDPSLSKYRKPDCAGGDQVRLFSIARRTSSADVRTPSFWRMMEDVLAMVL